MYTLRIFDRAGRQLEAHSVNATPPSIHDRIELVGAERTRFGTVGAVLKTINIVDGVETQCVVSVLLDAPPPAPLALREELPDPGGVE